MIFWVALIVRLAYITLAHTYRLKPYDHYFSFGWEMGRIGRALATGYGYADPFRGHTGPTAWVTPLYPLLMGGVFKLTGVFTPLSAWILLAIDSVFSALMVRTTWEIGARVFNTRVARWSGWLWALYPAAMQYAVRWIWEMTLSAFLLSWVYVLALRMCNIGGPPEEAATAASPRRWAIFGLLWGLIALSNASLLVFLPACGLWVLIGALRSGSRARQQAVGVVLASFLCLACIAPWTYRNWRVFHQFIPMRANFGAELYMGNGPGSVGLLMEYYHPFQDATQLRLYREMGEVAYAKMRGRMAEGIIKADPAHFAGVTLRRIYFFWSGVLHTSSDHRWEEYGRDLNFQFISIAGLLGLALALYRKVPGAWLFAWAFITLPFIYYFVTVAARFRHPLEPLITVLAVNLFQSAEKRRKPLTPAV
ncbi:MAG: glycosyltransferase family 39 protein [Acidobacteria bacterium]|nr:glycosyltransferase family 39 protein [Acidobacteriota bacterium]